MNALLEVDGLLFEAEQAGVVVTLLEGGGMRVWGRRSIAGAWNDRLRPIKQDVVAYLELAALVAPLLRGHQVATGQALRP